MPMNEHEPTFRIADNLAQVRLWEIAEAGVTLRVECVSCHRRSAWPPERLRRTLARNLANRLVQVAGRFRCAACRSAFVRIGREPADAGQTPDVGVTLRDDPGRKRGFTHENLDANARGPAAFPRSRR